MNNGDNRNNTSQYSKYTSTSQMNTTSGMNTGTMNKNSRTGIHKKAKMRFRPTKEGMIALAELFLIIVVVVLVIFLVIKGIQGRGSGKETTASTTAETTTAPVEVKKWYSGFINVNADTSSLHEGILVLVNDKTEYTFPSKMESKLTDLYGKTNGHYVLSNSSLQLNRTIVGSLSDFCEAMKAANQETLGTYTDASGKQVIDKLLITSGYRSKVYQQTLYNENGGDSQGEDGKIYSAAPGFSEHHTGLAIDIKIYTASSKTVDLRAGEYAWMSENCFRYGFIQRYSDSKFALTGISGEEWHYRFVDTPHAYAMNSLGLCLEEYLDMLKTKYSCTSDAPFEITTDKAAFMVYYVPADKSSDITYIPVPSGAKAVTANFYSESELSSGMYTVSGNNTDGFIVTVVK